LFLALKQSLGVQKCKDDRDVDRAESHWLIAAGNGQDGRRCHKFHNHRADGAVSLWDGGTVKCELCAPAAENVCGLLQNCFMTIA
jgi:hypothetical protein